MCVNSLFWGLRCLQLPVHDGSTSWYFTFTHRIYFFFAFSVCSLWTVQPLSTTDLFFPCFVMFFSSCKHRVSFDCNWRGQFRTTSHSAVPDSNLFCSCYSTSVLQVFVFLLIDKRHFGLLFGFSSSLVFQYLPEQKKSNNIFCSARGCRQASKPRAECNQHR